MLPLNNITLLSFLLFISDDKDLFMPNNNGTSVNINLMKILFINGTKQQLLVTLWETGISFFTL